MKSLLKPVIAAGLMLTAASPLVEAPAFAQAMKGIGYVNVNAVISKSNAFKVAEEQRPTTYQQQITQADAKASELNAQLDPMIAKFKTDSESGTVDQATLQQQARAIEQIRTAGQREVDRLMAPFDLSRAYVGEQIGDKLADAIKVAADKKGISLVLRPGQMLYADPGYDISDSVVVELDALLPVAQLVPPPGWLPREMREQYAAQQAAAGGAQPAAEAPVAGSAPEGR